MINLIQKFFIKNLYFGRIKLQIFIVLSSENDAIESSFKLIILLIKLL